MSVEKHYYQKNMNIDNTDALLIDQIIDRINQISEIFKLNNGKIILTQDWHPKNHKSFASSYNDKNPGDEYNSDGIGPILWPDHCVQGTKGAQFHDKLNVDLVHAIIRKGNSLKIKKIFICGLALDYCCYYTALDGLAFGFEVCFLVNLTRGIDLPLGNISKSLQYMRDKGIKFATKDNLI